MATQDKHVAVHSLYIKFIDTHQSNSKFGEYMIQYEALVRHVKDWCDDWWHAESENCVFSRTCSSKTHTCVPI